MKEAGFEVIDNVVDNVGEISRANGVPDVLRSCHTAKVGDYAIEGHIPAAEVIRLLEEAPKVQGLATPGMPIGSPGMEGPNAKPYNVLAFDSTGRVSVYAHITP